MNKDVIYDDKELSMNARRHAHIMQGNHEGCPSVYVLKGGCFTMKSMKVTMNAKR